MDYAKELGEEKLLFLKHIYKEVNGNIGENCNLSRVGQLLSLKDNEIFCIFTYLQDKGFIVTDFGGNAQITSSGIDVVENSPQLSGREINQLTQHITNRYENSGQITNSQIMQGSVSSSQNFSLTQQQNQNLKEFINLFERKLSEIQFQSADDKQEAISDVSTIKAQLDSPKPKWEIIKSAGNTLKGVLEKAAAIELVEYLKDLF